MRADRRLGKGSIDRERLGDDLGEIERLAAVAAFKATEGLKDGVTTGPSHARNAATTPDRHRCALAWPVGIDGIGRQGHRHTVVR